MDSTIVSNRFYEGMFLVDANWAANSFDEVQSVVQGLVEKVGGSLRRLEKWQDRRLEYPIYIERTVHRRGCYVLTSSELPNNGPSDLYREIELDTRFLRCLILKRRADEIDRIFDQFEDLDARRRGSGDDEGDDSSDDSSDD
ncbi:MAG: 30S ribosomal protein S6 [Planctomycetota bacterium]